MISEQNTNIEVLQSTPPQSTTLGDRFTNATNNRIVIDAPGFESSEISAMLIAGTLSIRAEKLDLKGKGKENEGCSRGPSNVRHLEADIDLPMGIQAEDIEAVLCAGRLTIQLPGASSMLPGGKEGSCTYRSYAVDLQGGSSHDSHYKYREDDAKELKRIQPLRWPDNLGSPLAEDGKTRLLQYLKGNNPSVWRVLVEPMKEETFVASVVTLDRNDVTSAFFHPDVRGAVYAVGEDSYDVDDFLHQGRKQGLKLSKSGSIIKELLTTTEAYLLLFKDMGPVAPEEGTFVRLLPSSNYPNALAYVIKREFDIQVAHILVLPVRIEFIRGPGIEITMTSIAQLEKKRGKPAHDFRRMAYGLIRGHTVFDCLHTRNISPSRQELEALEECGFEPVLKASQILRRSLIDKGDRVRVISGEFMGLVGWAAGPMVSDTVEVMPMTPILNHDIVGIEVLSMDLNRLDLRNGDEAMVIRGPFAGVTVEVIEYLDDDMVHAKVKTPMLFDPRAKVYNHEIIRIVEIGDYVEVTYGIYEGCMGYAAEDKWQSCQIYVDAVREAADSNYHSMALLQTWIDVDYHNLRVLRPFRPQLPTCLPQTTDDKEPTLDDRFATRFIGMEVYIVYHKHLKGSLGRILETFHTHAEDGRESRRFTVLPARSMSAYTYEMEEWELLEALVAARRLMGHLPSDSGRSSTPDNTNDSDIVTALRDTFGNLYEECPSDTDSAIDEIKQRAIQSMVSDGSWLLDRRLMHRKLEIEIAGTKGSGTFRKGIYEGCKGYTIITEPIRSVACDIFVKVDSMESSPMTRIPIKYLWPKSSIFPPSWRVVVKGGTLEDNESYIGSYALIAPCTYELDYNVRLAYILPSGPYEYFQISSLCSSGTMAEWLGYRY
ncbi:hypothetical protein PLEOSDRAFT_1102604 [Pleurotus ostreatus PC15]|uniref:SHSP domain-containing protein n=1 Tax=Pleurotus ostreatus (strain PC15) TaxID=1137138 RepID=A0A067NWN5_PLEO1|nr:hypothetical protein PLEOSDRAFT_1102604 [Pleurotus ostreatus PC15]